jgi:hypothetical protein
MTKQELQAELARPVYADMVAANDDVGLAAALNARTISMAAPRLVNARTVMAELDNGAAILDKLSAAAANVSDVKWSMYFLTSEGGLDVGHPRAQAQLDLLAAAHLLTADEAAALKNLAFRLGSRAEQLWGFNAVITPQIVSDALRNP